MKLRIIVVVLLGAFRALSQGTLVYDQQSTTGGRHEGVVNIQSSQPVGQSFTPTVTTVGFIQLETNDQIPGNSLGAVIFVNLRMDSITGQIIGQSDPFALPDNFEGATTFYFSLPVAISPGTTYYFQPVVQSGDSWSINESFAYHYSGGSAILNGVASPTDNLYFREGLVAPEPSTWALLLALGGGALFLRRRKVA